MARIDLRLAVILVVATILSTLIVLSIFRVSEPEDVTVLRNKFPEIFMKDSSQKGVETTFSFGALLGREMKDVELRFSVLYEEPPVYDSPEYVPDEGARLSDIAAHIPAIAALLSKVEELGGEVEELDRVIEVNETWYEATLYDFTSFLGIFNSDEAMSQTVSAFALLRRGSEVRYFKGRTGFFLSQGETVKYLMISHNENKTEYVGDGILEAPIGVLRFAEPASDDKISVIYEVMVRSDELPEIPMGKRERMILQMIKMYGDGGLLTLVVNGVPMG